MPKDLERLLKITLKGLLKPIAHFCLRRGIKIQFVYNALKASFYEAASKELSDNQGSASVSKIAAMTGLQRRDVNKIAKQDIEELHSSNILTKILGQWHQDKRFLDGKGKPKTLSCEGADSEFAKLVTSVSQDLNPYTILFELERIKAVKKVDQKVELTSSTFLPAINLEEALELLTRDSANLVYAVEENIFSKTEIPNLHITTEYDNVSKDAADDLRRLLLEKGAEFHAKAREILSKYDKDLNPSLFEKEGGTKVVLSTFSRVIDPKDEEES